MLCCNWAHNSTNIRGKAQWQHKFREIPQMSKLWLRPTKACFIFIYYRSISLIKTKLRCWWLHQQNHLASSISNRLNATCMCFGGKYYHSKTKCKFCVPVSEQVVIQLYKYIDVLCTFNPFYCVVNFQWNYLNILHQFIRNGLEITWERFDWQAVTECGFQVIFVLCALEFELTLYT